jgi:hypothetical protein
MQQDIANMLREGWYIQSQFAVTPKQGAIRVLAGGPVFLNRKLVTTVVFSRPAAISLVDHSSPPHLTAQGVRGAVGLAEPSGLRPIYAARALAKLPTVAWT